MSSDWLILAHFEIDEFQFNVQIKNGTDEYFLAFYFD